MTQSQEHSNKHSSAAAAAAAAAASSGASSSTLVNGINVSELGSTVGAIRKDPGLGVAVFQASNRWLGANHNRTTVKKFFAARQDIEHQQAFELDADEPPILAGEDSAANPVEHLLHAVCSCLTTSLVAHAAVRGIPLLSVESTVEGKINLNGYLGLDPDVPRGYEQLTVKFVVETEPKYRSRLKELAEFSPVFNTVKNGVPIDLQVGHR